MNVFKQIFISGIYLTLFAVAAFAQLPLATPKVSPNNNVKKKTAVAKAEADRIRRSNQEQARSLLLTLSSDARRFSNQTLRARTLARIAEALWGADDEQGRALFREAWNAAETADKESENRSDVRREILKLIATRDGSLAEQLLKKLKADEDEQKAASSLDNAAPVKNNSWELSAALEKGLSLAEDLLNAGDIERALQFADPVLGNVTISTLDFLSLLREKNPVAADHRYALMLANTSGNAAADANTISVLSSYIFTPQTYFIFNDVGTYDLRTVASPLPPANVNSQLRLAFFQTASSVLLRPHDVSAQAQRPAGTISKYMVLKLLMPAFEQYAPRELTDAMRGQVATLTPLISDDVRRHESESPLKSVNPDRQNIAEQEQSLLSRIERATTSNERDDLYFQMALLALNKDDLKARDYVEKIEERGFRKQAQAWVDAKLVINAVNKKRIETALELSRTGELTPIQRVWVLTQVAKLLATKDKDKAMMLINDATAEVRRIESGTLDKPRGLLAVANALLLIEPSRKWEATFDAIKAANSTEKFTGEGGGFIVQVGNRVLISRGLEAVPDFDIQGIFGKLAKDNFNEAAQLAVNFQGEAARTNAVIAAARAVLSNNKATFGSRTRGGRL